MKYKGLILHHSRCPSINGKGFDFWIGSEGDIFAAPLLTDPDYIHLCLEGDFSKQESAPSPAERKEQLFATGKLIFELAERYQISPLIIEHHTNSCPGTFFPWNELVIYPSDGYH